MTVGTGQYVDVVPMRMVVVFNGTVEVSQIGRVTYPVVETVTVDPAVVIVVGTGPGFCQYDL